MTAIGAITLSAAGSVTEPTDRLKFTFPSADSIRFAQQTRPVSITPIPELSGFLLADGFSPLRHVCLNLLRTGPLPPSAALTAAGTSVRATATLTNTSGTDFANNDVIDIYGPVAGNWTTANFDRITFKTAFSTNPTTHEVKRGTNVATTLANLQKLINGTGTQGSEYVDLAVYGGFSPDYTSITARIEQKPYFVNFTDIESSAVSATVLTLRSKTWGVGGNANHITEVTDSGAVWSVAAWAGGTAGTGTAPDAGNYQYRYAHLREEDNHQTALSPRTVFQQTTNANVSLSVIADAIDADLTAKRWLRTTGGNGTEFYRGYDIPEADTTDTDDITDTTLVSRFGAIPNDETTQRAYEAGYPPRYRFVCSFKGHYFGMGAILAADARHLGSGASTFTMTNGSASFQAVSSFYLNELHEGRFIVFFGYGEPYQIVRVDMSTTPPTGYLDRVWEAANGTPAGVIQDLRDPCEIGFTPEFRVNDWPVDYTINSVRDATGEGITGCRVMFKSIIIFTRTGIWRLVGDAPENFEVHQINWRVGCASHFSIVADERFLYWMGPDGFYRMGSDFDPVSISTPPDAPESGIDRTFARVNMAHGHNVYGHLDRATGVARWAVPLDTDITNRHELVYDTRLGEWMGPDTVEDRTCYGEVARPDGTRVVLGGDVEGVVSHVDLGNSDGAFGFEPVQTTTTGGTGLAVVVTGSPGFSSVLRGMPVWFVSAAGDVTRNTVESISGSTIALRRAITAVAAGLQIVVGGIALDIETGRFTQGTSQRKTLDILSVLFDVDVDGEMFFAFAREQGTPTVRAADPKIDLTTSDGERRMRVQVKGRSHKLRFLALEPGCDPTLFGLRLSEALQRTPS